MTTRAICYWMATALLVCAMVSRGVVQLVHQRETIEGLTKLGYPAYVATILGVWKILGGVTFFDTTGAAVSHAMSNDYGRFAFHVVVPIVLAALVLASWAIRPPGRKIG